MSEMKPPPNKRFRLVCWWLTCRLPLNIEDVQPHVAAARAHAKMSSALFREARKGWPRELEKVREKRERQRAISGYSRADSGWISAP